MSNLGITPLSNSVYATSKNQSARNVNFRGVAEATKKTAEAAKPKTGKILKNFLFGVLTMVGVVAAGTVFNSCKNKALEVPNDVPAQTIKISFDPGVLNAIGASNNETAQYISSNINPNGYSVENRDGKLYLQNVSDEEAKEAVKAMLLLYDNVPENFYFAEKAIVHSLAETYLEPENQAVEK